MKKTLVFLTLFCSLFCTTVFAQVSMEDILRRSIIICRHIEGENNQILFMQIDNLQRNQRAVMSYSLNSGSSYTAIALGDDGRIKDIDIAVFDENQNEIASDNDASNVAVAQINPRWSGKFYFKISAYEMFSLVSDGFYALIIYRNY